MNNYNNNQYYNNGYNNQGKPLSYYIKRFLLAFLFIVIFIFLLLWLLPNKASINPISDQIFQNNLTNMKDVTTSYYTKDRLPQNEGESKKLTLQEMMDMKLLLNVTDKNGKACNARESYTEIIKLENEYKLKVNLKCGDTEDYIVTYLGCYKYCDDDSVCEKKAESDDDDDSHSAKPNRDVANNNSNNYSNRSNYSGNNNGYSKSSNYSYNNRVKKSTKKKVVNKTVKPKNIVNKTTKTTVINKTVNITNITKTIVNKITNITIILIPHNPTPSPQPVKHYCEVIDGTYYDKNGNVVSPTEYEKSCKEPAKHYCEIVDGKYYDKNGNVVNGDEYEESCNPKPEKHYCEVVDGKYYDKDGNVVSKSDYEKSCNPEPEKHYCEIVDGKYYDKEGNIVSKEDYEKSCKEKPKYRYQYEKTCKTCYDKQYSEWSDWSENIEYDPTNNTIPWGQNELTWYEKNGYKVVQYYEYTEDRTKPIINETYDNLLGYKKVYACDGYTYFMDRETNTYYTTTTSPTSWVYQRTETMSSVPASTLTTKYEVVGMDYDKCEKNCTLYPKYKVKVYTRTIQTATNKVSNSKDSLSAVCNVTYKEVPIYGVNKEFVGYVTNRELKEKTIYYYHKKTRELIKDAYCDEKTLYVWSYSPDDQTLINQGFRYNGKKEAIYYNN